MPMPAPCPLPRVSPRLIARGLTLVLALSLWLALPRVASAHAHLAWADPAPDSVLAHAPSVGAFLFDEPLNPALTRVHISDASGHLVTADTGHLAPGHGGALWLLPLPRLAAGTYSVFWTSESATDGHVMGSFYTFRIAPAGSAGGVGAVSGTAGGAGAVSGTAGGAYGVGTASASGGGAGGIGLTVGALGTALVHWIGLAAQALWLGCLLVEVLVLAPARQRGAPPEARLAWAATRRLWRLAGAALVVAALALAGETLSVTLQGTGGDLGRALDPTILGGVLSSQNGRLVVARAAVLLVALLVAVLVRVPKDNTTTATVPLSVARAPRSARAPRALGIVAQAAPPALPRLPRLPWAWTLPGLVTLALADLLLTAFAGHASDVTPAALSYAIDWLHLVCTAAWAGGIAALAWGVMPLRRALAPAERAPAALPLLDRFSPVAYTAVAILTLSGLYNAVNHLDAPQRLADTLYGQQLDVKVALVAVLIALSASHVYQLRPRIARLQRQFQQQSPSVPGRADAVVARESAAAGVHEGLATLAARLRLEGGVGAAILLATALMSQTLPQSSPPSSASVAPSTDATPASITGTTVTGNLRGQLTVVPPAVGSATFTLALSEGGTALSGDTGAAVIHLYPVDQPASIAPLDTVAHGTRFVVAGSLAATGTWRADVLVRTAATPDYRTLPFTFTVGPGAAFILPGLNPAAVSLAIAPGLLSAPNTVTIAGVQAPAVRLLSQSLDMLMGSIPYDTTPLGGGRWRVSNLFAPMNGRWELTVQAQRDGGWITVRRVVYQVPLSGIMRLLTPRAQGQGSASAPSAASSRIAQGAVPARGANLSAPFNVAFARTLPYTALVTEMGSNGVRTLTGPLLPTGLQAHGVDVLDGTPYAYVTNFGADPGTVSQIDLRSMRVVRTFTVGLGPAHVVFAPDHRRAFVTDFHSADLFVLDLTNGATQRIAFPGDNCFEPHGLDISEGGHTLFVACAGGAWIYTVDARTLRPGRLVITAPGAFGVAVDAPRHEVWVTNQTANSVTVLDETTLAVRATIPVGKGPALLVPTPDGGAVYVADQLGNTVSVIDAGGRRVVATILVAAQPHGPDVTADGRYVYVASIGGNAVTIIRTSDNRVVAVVPSAVGSNEVAIAH